MSGSISFIENRPRTVLVAYQEPERQYARTSLPAHVIPGMIIVAVAVAAGTTDATATADSKSRAAAL